MCLQMRVTGCPTWKQVSDLSVRVHCLLIYLLTYSLTFLLTYLLTYLLTPWSTVLLEKLTGLQIVKKLPAFYWTRRFVTAFTSARHLSLPWPSWIHIQLLEDPAYYSPIYAWVSQVVSFLQISPLKFCISLSPPLHVLHAPPISLFSILSPVQYYMSSTVH